MKKVMKFVKGKKDDDSKTSGNDLKKTMNEKQDEYARDDDLVLRDKSITKLHKAVWNENTDKLKSIIKTYDIDITDKLDRTALYFAVLKNNIIIVNLLLENYANQHIPDIDGITPFLKSVQLGYKEGVMTLLNYGADLKRCDKDSNSCLHLAVLGSHNEILSMLLSNKCDTNTSNLNGEYPLHIAVKMKNQMAVEMLLNHGSLVNVVDSNGMSPLMFAAQQGCLDIILILEKYVVDIEMKDNKGKTAIDYALAAGFNNVATKLQSKPALQNVKTHSRVSSKTENSVSESWNDSPVPSPSKKPEKHLKKISERLYQEDAELSEENSECEVSVKCSQNTSPQSGIIPPPCKPLRSLEYIQSGGLTLDNRPVHLLTLGTMRTRHISMTESDHSKNNTPHRYSYQGDFQVDLSKMPEEKVDSVNVSVKSKILSKIDCDSTIQSDWGSNESLPLDELPCSKREPKINQSNTTLKDVSNPNSFREKDTFLQKQFSILENFEKNHEKHCSASQDIDKIKKLDENCNKSGSHLDDINNLLEDNNRINAQLERYAGQSDFSLVSKKSKSLPRNYEPPCSFYKGSMSLPRTLESGKDPFKEMKPYHYFRPRFMSSSKSTRSESTSSKKSGFIDKIKNIFIKKSQIHLTVYSEQSGTWLYRDRDHSSVENDSNIDKKSCKTHSSYSMSESSGSKKSIHSEKVSVNIDDHPCKDAEAECSSKHLPSSNCEHSKGYERKLLMISQNFEVGHSRKSSSSRSFSDKINDENKLSEDSKSSKGSVKMSAFCDDCSDYYNLKILEYEQTLSNKENFIILLQDQIMKLKDRMMQSIDEIHDTNFKYGLVCQELSNVKQICSKYEEEMQKLLAEKINRKETERDASKMREEADKWKKQYEEIINKINNMEKSTTAMRDLLSSDIADRNNESTKISTAEEQRWQNLFQNEIQNVITVLRENSQSVVESLEKQNKKLEALVEKLQKDLEASSVRQQELENKLSITKNELNEITLGQMSRDDYECNSDCIKMLNDEKMMLQNELESMKNKYEKLSKEYTSYTNAIEENCKASNNIAHDCNVLKEENMKLCNNLEEIFCEIQHIQDEVANKKQELCFKLLDGNADDMSVEIANVDLMQSPKIEEIDMTSFRKLLADIQGLYQDYFDLAGKLKESEYRNVIGNLEKANSKLKEEFACQTQLVEALKNNLRTLENRLIEFEKNNKDFQHILAENVHLKNDNAKILNDIKNTKEDIDNKEDIIQAQNSKIDKLLHDLQDKEQKKHTLENELDKLRREYKTFEENAQKLNTYENEIHILSTENNNLSEMIHDFDKKNKSMFQQLQFANAVAEEEKHKSETLANKLKSIEKLNLDLKDTVQDLIVRYESLLSENKNCNTECEKYDEKCLILEAENESLKKQMEQNKKELDCMCIRADSLKCYHDNEMISKNARLKEIKQEYDNLKSKFRESLDQLTAENTLLEQTLKESNASKDLLFKELEESRKRIWHLQEEVKTKQNEENTNADLLEKLNIITRENIELKSAIDTLRSVLENKTIEPTAGSSDSSIVNIHNIVSEIVMRICAKDSASSTKITKCFKTQSKCSKTKKFISKIPTRLLSNYKKVSSKTSLPEIGENLAMFTKKINSSDRINKEENENKMNECSNRADSTLTALEVVENKSQSMPNLENIIEDCGPDCNCNENVNYLYRPQKVCCCVRKTSSVDCLVENKVPDSNVQTDDRWQKHFDTLQNLRTEINSLRLKLRKKGNLTTYESNADYYKDLISSLQRQVNALQIQAARESSKNYGLRVQVQGLKGNLVSRTELEKQIQMLHEELEIAKYDKMKEYEQKLLTKDAEMNTMKEEMKRGFLEQKQKLLNDMTSLQSELCVKNEQELKLRQKFDQLLKEVSEKHECKKKKSTSSSRVQAGNSSKSHRRSSNGSNLSDKVTTYPGVQVMSCPILRPLPTIYGYVPHATTSTVETPSSVSDILHTQLDMSIKRHRILSDPSPVARSASDEELWKKYLVL